jgi:hypothetical protein
MRSAKSLGLNRGRSFWPLVIAGLVATTSCSKTEKKGDAPAPTATAAALAAPKVALKFKPDAQQEATVTELLKKLNRENWRFPSKESNKPENARLFTYIAATAQDPVVVGAALSAMYGAYSSHSKRKAQPDGDFVAVVKLQLASADPKIASRALLAARTAVAGTEGDKELIASLIALAPKYKTGAGRYALIDTLRVVSVQNRSPALMQIFSESLDASEPFVASYALQALYRSTRSIEDMAAVKAKALKLAKHADPGVRGRALELLGSIGRGDSEVLALVDAGLKDADPYVRSEACEAAARLHYRSALHEIIKLVDDKANNRYDLRGWTALDGKPGRLHHDGSPWSFVYDAAMNAVRSLSAGDLKLERINPKEIEPGLIVNARLTKDWYAKNKAKLPPPGTPPEDPPAPAASSAKPAASAGKPKAAPSAKPLAPKPPAPPTSP